MTKRERNAFYADRWVRVANRNYKRDIKLWGADETEMVNLVKNDLRDHLACASLMRRGKVKEAADRACDFDTSSRDAIPASVWDYILSTGYYN